MKNIKTYAIDSNYTLKVLDGKMFRVVSENTIMPEIEININYENPKQAIVQIQTTAQGALDAIDMEFYISELQGALRAVDEIKFILSVKYDMDVV